MDESKVKNEEPKVLLTQGEDGKLKVITGEQNGKLKTVDPKKENADQFIIHMNVITQSFNILSIISFFQFSLFKFDLAFSC